MIARSKTAFAEMVAACGLSQTETAALTGRSLSGIQKMFLGAPIPDDVMDALAMLYAEVEARSGDPTLGGGAAARREAILELRRRATRISRAKKENQS